MTEKNKKIKHILAGIFAVSAVIGMVSPVFAEDTSESPVLTFDKANLTVRYFDDSDEEIPVVGSEFTIYQVAEIGRELQNNGAYVPLDDSLDFSDIDEYTYNDADALAYEEKVINEYKEHPDIGYKATLPIGKDGLAVFKDIPVGAYLITETKTARYHITSIPFIVSIPELNESNTGWGYEITANPKPILAGDLEITKITKGKIKSEDKSYTLKINLPKGEFRATLPDGKQSTVKNGDKISIKGGETLKIYDIPSGGKYRVTEVEANGTNHSGNFRTTYTNNKGTIIEKNATKVKIVNDSTDFDTGAGYHMLFEMMIGGGALAFLIFLICSHSKKTDKK